jgi:flavin reductase (DIM6/NTAB) family NADH-FMN oxidoreductase RutF
MTNVNFKDVKILDNFYQTSSFYPMPVVLISTLSESGQTNLGPYSLCFPFRIAGKGKQSMLLTCRDNSNTAQNILRTGVAAINFIPDKKKYLKNCVLLGFPGETTEEKMNNSNFTLLSSQREADERESDIDYPEIVAEAVQVFECSLDPDFEPWTDDDTIERHIILRIDKIVLKEKWYNALMKGKGFPRLPIDYGYRNNANFWISKHRKPRAYKMPKSKNASVNTVMYAAQRIDPDVTWEEEACARLIRVPRIFLNRVLKGIVSAAKEEGLTVITAQFVDKMADKRNEEKQ